MKFHVSSATVSDFVIKTMQRTIMCCRCINDVSTVLVTERLLFSVIWIILTVTNCNVRDGGHTVAAADAGAGRVRSARLKRRL